MKKSAIIAGTRTPFGKFGGVLKDVKAVELGGRVIESVLEEAEVEKETVDEVIMGMVLQGGQGQIPSRQASREAGLPWSVKTETINKVCASGMRSVTLADQLIRLGDEETIIAGGMESMSNAPYFLPDARWGNRMGDKSVKDLMMHDGLTCSFTGAHMGTYGSSTAAEYNVTREQQDEWALRSHERALAAIKEGLFTREITPIKVAKRKSDPVLVDTDEGPRSDTSLEKLRKLKPAFDKDGTITAGNAPGVNDGACAFLMMEEEKAKEAGKEVLATILGHASLAVPAKDFPKTPGLVINQLLEKTGKRKEDIDRFEINEAFAAVSLASMKIAGLDEEKINVNGGAVALGHPIGASGARIILTLIHELKRCGGGLGIAAICSGGGQGDAILIEVPA